MGKTHLPITYTALLLVDMLLSQFNSLLGTLACNTVRSMNGY